MQTTNYQSFYLEIGTCSTIRGGGGERIKNVQEQKVNVSERVLTLVLFVKTNLQRLKIGEM